MMEELHFTCGRLDGVAVCLRYSFDGVENSKSRPSFA